jgi:hypothetical protein
MIRAAVTTHEKEHEEMISAIWDHLYEILYKMKCEPDQYGLHFSFPAEKTYMDEKGRKKTYQYRTVTFGEFYTLRVGDIVTYPIGTGMVELMVLENERTGRIVYSLRRLFTAPPSAPYNT